MADYAKVTARVAALDQRFRPTVLETIGSYPVYAVLRDVERASAYFWINAGTHGDEPAGVEAALAFLESHLPDLYPNAGLIVTPCLNPYGYVAEHRENADGVDVNWAFDRDDVPEIRLIKQIIDRRRYDAVIDLHEDWESPGYYLYEQCGDRKPLGFRITSRVAKHCPVNQAEVIEGERAEHGVIFPSMDVPKRKSGRGVPVEVFLRAAHHQITSESPTSRLCDERVRAHLVAIEVFLETYGAE